MAEIQLYDHQEEHYKRVETILSFNAYYGDISDPGVGKTFIALKYAKDHALKLAVVGPGPSIHHWKTRAQEYGIPLYDEKGIFTYESLRAMTGSQPKHGLLTREDDKKDGKNNVRFYPTKLLFRLIEEGLFLVFDEAQALKNRSQQQIAATELIRPFLSRKTASRFCFLSATLTDKLETPLLFLRMVGVIHSARLYTGRKGIFSLQGLRELIEEGERIAPELTKEFTRMHDPIWKPSESKKYVFDFFAAVIVPTVFSSMPNILHEISYKDEKNGFYRMPEKESKDYRSAIEHLNEITRGGNIDPDNLGKISQALQALELTKAPIFVRKAKEHLNKNKKAKVILFVNYYCTIDYLERHLKEYHPLFLTGKAKDTKIRTKTVDNFQEASEEFRLLIATVRTGGVSLNLQDITGDYPRYVYIMPNYHAIPTVQAADRTFRLNMKGSAFVRIVYGHGGELENRLLDTMARKCALMKSLSIQKTMRFPGDYEAEYES